MACSVNCLYITIAPGTVRHSWTRRTPYGSWLCLRHSPVHSLTQTNDPLPLLAYSDGSGFTSRLTRLALLRVDIWPSVCCLTSSRPLACWLGRPKGRLPASCSLHRILQTEYTNMLSPTSRIPADTPNRCLPCEVLHRFQQSTTVDHCYVLRNRRN